MKRHGPDAKVIVLPYGVYQLPAANMVRMDASAMRHPEEALAALTQRAVPGLDARGMSAEPPNRGRSRLDDNR